MPAMWYSRAEAGRNVWRWREAPPDLILVDLSMPVLDGWGVFAELKADRKTQTIPCLAVTAHAELDRNEALETGFSGYISKPFSGDHLLKTIATVLAKRSLSAER